ncbi:MAG: pyridoxal phosphate-dependent decarboxylase family protein [Woeseiaceae bacterium]
MSDAAFRPDRVGLERALDALLKAAYDPEACELPERLKEDGLGELPVIDLLAPLVLGRAQRLGAPTAFAHMDPPTPWITWAMCMWNAALNQNLLHPDVAPMARRIERRVLEWLAPFFGMNGGHMTPGSTVSNLTALWAAREIKGIDRVVASAAAHVSVAKSAHLLGLRFQTVPTDNSGRLNCQELPEDMSGAALVLTAGTTSAGAIDALEPGNRGAWTHIDAAWAGPLRLSDRYRDRLAGMESADSVAVSAHKWLFQPKESGLVFFRDTDEAHRAVSFGADYLAVPNTGLLGSHGANAVPLLATLAAWGRKGVAERIDRAMARADALIDYLFSQPDVEVFSPNASGVILWRIRSGIAPEDIVKRLSAGSASIASAGGVQWVRHVAANPDADVDRLTRDIGVILAGNSEAS